MTQPPSRKATRAKKRGQRQATRDRRRRERDRDGLDPALTGSPDHAAARNLMPVAQLRRRKTFELLERTCSELVVLRERQVLELVSAAAGSDEYDRLAREIEALDDEIDDLRELSDELLRRVAPLDVADDRLAQLEQMLTTAQALANASARAQALLGAAQELLAAIDDAIDGGSEA
ncbi:MAG TPA: hypothetical protein VM869_29935 [Enhygromyxa sp.]|nr:hypothetical protein [Enhygromyxa sp.]